MFDWVDWFGRQLQTSAEGFVWAFSRIDSRYHLRIPPDVSYLGEWPPARHIWHVAEYERCIALVSMRQWLGGAIPGKGAWTNDDAAWTTASDLSSDELIARFQEAQQQQHMALIEQLANMDWDEPRETIWGNKPLSMIVTKTYQHRFEHGNTLLKMGLWWADIEQEQAEADQ